MRTNAKKCVLLRILLYLCFRSHTINYYTMVQEDYMRRCLELAEKGFGSVSPNPMVGAVIVCDGEIIGEGYHQQYGGPHAEVNAIASVKDPSLLKRSTIYVSLEPCCHYGKTPPCADLIIEKGIPHVVVCNRDPFPAVDGKGIEKLQEAGVSVEFGLLEEQGRWLNRRFFTFHEKRRPYILLKWAQTKDGYMADLHKTEGQPPLQISTPETLVLSHRLRATETAILVGPNTALLDNPSLTVRYAEGRNPVRILIDRNLRVPTSAHLYDGEVHTIVFTKEQPDRSFPNVEFVSCPFDVEGRIAFEPFLQALYERKIESLIVEGGKLTLQSFLDAELWDEIRVERNHSMVIGAGVEAPSLSGLPTPYTQYSCQIVGDNDITYYRRC